MKRFLVLSIFSAMPALSHAEMSGSDLLSLCKSTVSDSRRMCSMYIFGVAQGLGMGQRLVEGSDKKVFASMNMKPVFCLPEGTSESRMAENFVRAASALKKTFPSDIEGPAVSIVSAALLREYTCPNIRK